MSVVSICVIEPETRNRPKVADAAFATVHAFLFMSLLFPKSERQQNGNRDGKKKYATREQPDKSCASRNVAERMRLNDKVRKK